MVNSCFGDPNSRTISSTKVSAYPFASKRLAAVSRMRAPLLEGPDAQSVRCRIRYRSPWTINLAFRTLQPPPPSLNRLTGRSDLCSVQTTSLPTGQLFPEKAEQSKSGMGGAANGEKGTV